MREEEIEDENDVSRETPAIDVARTYAVTGLELGGAGAALEVSPARSARVLRFKVFPGGSIAEERALVAEADISNSFPGVGIWLGGRSPEVNCSRVRLHVDSTLRATHRIFAIAVHIESIA